MYNKTTYWCGSGGVASAVEHTGQTTQQQIPPDGTDILGYRQSKACSRQYCCVFSLRLNRWTSVELALLCPMVDHSHRGVWEVSPHQLLKF